HYNQRRYDDAWRAGERALLIHRALPMRDGVEEPLTLAWLGSIANARHQPDKAEPYFRAVLEAYNRLPSKALEATAARVATTLTIILRGRGQITETEPFIKRAVEITRRMRPVDELTLASNLELLASAYLASGRFKEVEAVAREVLEINT